MKITFFISFVLFSLHMVGLGFQPRHVASMNEATTPKEHFLSNVSDSTIRNEPTEKKKQGIVRIKKEEKSISNEKNNKLNAPAIGAIVGGVAGIYFDTIASQKQIITK